MKAETKKILKIWKKSFRLDAMFFYVLIYDLMFYAICGASAYLFFKILQKKAAVLSAMDINAYLASAVPAELQQLSAHLKSFVMWFCIGIIALLLIGLFSYTLSRTLIWNKITKKGFNIFKYAKFLVLNLIMSAVLCPSFFAYMLLLRLNPEVYAVLLYFIALLVLYIMFLVKMHYTKTGRIFQSIALGFERINWTAYLMLIPAFAAVAAAAILLSIYLKEFPIANLIIFVWICVAFMAWMRIFIAEADAFDEKKIKKNAPKKKR